MKRTQVQLPEALYREVKRVADLHGWSVTEVLRRGAEYLVRCYPPVETQGSWSQPSPMDLGSFRAPVEQWRELANDGSDS